MTVPISQLILLQLPMDLHLIGPELVVKIRVDIKRRKHTIHEIQTLNPT